MKSKSVLISLFCLIFEIMFFSCTSLQDINIEQSGISGEFLEIHSSFALVDGAFANGKGDEKAAENLISMMNSELSDPGLLKAAAARIYALEGCVALRLGRKSEAKKLYSSSSSAAKGDVYAQILAHRINPEIQLDKNSVIGNDKAILVLEEALDFYSSKDYISAVSSFDEAFLSLADFYKNGYGALRDKSWNLRNISVEKSDSANVNSSSDSEKLNSLLLLEKINVSQMLLITDKKSNFLFNLTGGKNLTEKDLYKKVIAAGLLNPATEPVLTAENSLESSSGTSIVAENVILADSIVNKFVCARFLWNLYNENKSLDKKTKYSARYSKIKMRSPVPDVPVSNPDFDAVLGCVENEFLNLDDGINFNGEKEISALEFSESLKKVDSGK